MTAGQILGIVLVFGLALVPSTLFVGVLAGGALRLTPMARLIATVATALALATGIVFFPGSADDPADSTSTSLPQ